MIKVPRSKLPQGLLVAILLAVSLPLAALAGAPAYPTHKCESYRESFGGPVKGTYLITILNLNVSCGNAEKITHEFLSGRGVTQHGHGALNATYWTLRYWPGWRCVMGAGGGACSYHKQTAEYELSNYRP